MFVYLFLNHKKEILYVGKTDNLKRRMSQHFTKNAHLPADCYDETYDVVVLPFLKEVDMTTTEIMFINAFSPKYNKALKTKKYEHIHINQENYKSFTISAFTGNVLYDKKILLLLDVLNLQRKKQQVIKNIALYANKNALHFENNDYRVEDELLFENEIYEYINLQQQEKNLIQTNEILSELSLKTAKQKIADLTRLYIND